ncbi:ATP-binding cassette domain-containing protein [Burkholderia thailandensis]|uniref:ATP-binding cassette domain-containing protein n=1 Tax=Burkholderia thailandensis TaxID=57975 RepID=UPI002358B308|nr:ATP-binding cassette domain-containing protein [Burkholderia thailandensis]
MLADVSLTLYPGEALALTGENGAGKSTLSKIVAGTVAPTTGAMRLAGAEVCAAKPRARGGARRADGDAGANLVPTLTVAENLFLDRLPHRFGVIDRRRLAADARTAMARVEPIRSIPTRPSARSESAISRWSRSRAASRATAAC